MATTWHHPLDTLERPARADGGAGRTAAEFRVTWQGLTEGLMDQITDPTKLAREPLNDPAARPRRRTWRTAAIGAVAVLALFLTWFTFAAHKANQAGAGASGAGDCERPRGARHQPAQPGAIAQA